MIKINIAEAFKYVAYEKFLNLDLGENNKKIENLLKTNLEDDYEKVFKDLTESIDNQINFGSKIKKYLEDYGFFDQNENQKTSDDLKQDNEIDNDKENNESNEQDKNDNNQSKTETDSSTLDLQETVSMEESDEIGEDSSDGEIEYFPKIENNNFIEEYKSFTKDYDEVINANELCDQKELEKLRYNLDKQVFSFLPLITKNCKQTSTKTACPTKQKLGF